MLEAFEKDGLLLNNHKKGISPKAFKKSKKITDLFKITATGIDDNKQPFVASYEAIDMPIFGSMYHPEKPGHLFFEGLGAKHSWHSFKNNRKFGDFFVSLARKNTNSVGKYDQIFPLLIENYDLIHSESKLGNTYVFK